MEAHSLDFERDPVPELERELVIAEWLVGIEPVVTTMTH